MPEPGVNEHTSEELAKGEQVTRYYRELDESDPANQPTDDETKTQPPFHSVAKDVADES